MLTFQAVWASQKTINKLDLSFYYPSNSGNSRQTAFLDSKCTIQLIPPFPLHKITRIKDHQTMRGANLPKGSTRYSRSRRALRPDPPIRLMPPELLIAKQHHLEQRGDSGERFTNRQWRYFSAAD